MDMSAAYWAAVMEHLPGAAIVFDRFHIIKLVNEKLEDLRREMVREAVGPMKQTVKGIRYLLLMRRENVQEEKLPRLDDALKHNEPLFTAYLLKEALGLLWEQPSYNHMRSFLYEWCAWADFISRISACASACLLLGASRQYHPRMRLPRSAEFHSAVSQV
ncbi:MAG: transposase [Verrucomicrobia bacterium]|nr:transposase [Verrucomicrobiota bacterium]